MRFQMGKKDKHHSAESGHENVDPEAMDNEKLFDFDKANPDDDEVTTEEDTDVVKGSSELEASIRELKDKQLRLLAEFDNYKKRTTKERLDLMNSASKEVILALLPVLDDFDRAKKSADNANNDEKFSEGVNLVFNRLQNTMQNLGLKVMESTGQPFDAEWHDAITDIPAPTEELKGKVLDTIEKGYLLNDKIIRHAKVIVGK